LSGILLIVLGAWGALIPFIGPYFNLSYTPDSAWQWSAARGWLEVLPGAVAVLGGLLSLMSSSRGVVSLGAWLGVGAGAWFVIGRGLADWWNIGSPGVPAGKSSAVHAVETLVMFTGLGALILFVAASAVGRLSVTSVRDVRVAQRRAAKDEKRDRRTPDSAYEQGHKDGLEQARADAPTTTATPTSTAPTSTATTAAPVGQHESRDTATAVNAPAPPPPPPARERPIQER